MSERSPTFNNWLLGEVSGPFAGRYDTEAYNQALSILENYIPLPIGALTGRPGTYFVGYGNNVGGRIRMIPYERGTFQNYVIELGDFYARFYTKHEQIVSGTPVEIVTPWPKEKLLELQFAQDDDELYIVHRDYAPRRIRRTTDDNTWPIDTPIGAPFNSAGNYPGCIAFWEGRMDLASTYNKPQTAWGSYVGDYTVWKTWSFEIDEAPTPSDWAPGATLTGLTSGATCVVVAKVSNVYYIVKDLSGDFQYGETVSDGTNSRACAAGYPKVFPSTTPVDPWEFKIGSKKAQTIQWMLDDTSLLVGASGGEFIFTGGEGPFYTNNFMIKRQSPWGSAPIQAVAFNDRALFVPKTKNKLRELYFTYERKGYLAPDMTALTDILDEGVDCMDVQNVPSPVLWLVRSDGELVLFAYDTSVRLMAWARVPIVGDVESVAIITSGGEDEIWLSIKQTIDTVTKRFIVYLAPRKWGKDQADAHCMDSGKVLDYGDPVAITNLTQADPIVATITGGPFANDDIVHVTDVEGMEEINGKYYMLKNKSDSSYDLYDDEGSDGIDGTFFYMDLAGAPSPADFSSGATLTGVSSGKTCEVFQKVISTRYLCRTRSGDFTDGEDIEDDDTPKNTATGAAGYPLIDDVYDGYVSGGTAQQHVKTVTGMTHLEGEEVELTVDGANHPRRTVDDGKVELQEYGNKIHYGHPYTPKLRLMRLNAGGETGLGVGKPKRIKKAIVGFYRSLNGQIGPNEDELTEFEWRSPTDPMGAPPPLFTGFKQITLQGTWDVDGWLMIVQDQPQPQTIMSIMPFVETQEL